MKSKTKEAVLTREFLGEYSTLEELALELKGKKKRERIRRMR